MRVHFILTIRVVSKLNGFITIETKTLIDLVMVYLTMLPIAKSTQILMEESRCALNVIQCYIVYVSTITLLYKVIQGYMFRL